MALRERPRDEKEASKEEERARVIEKKDRAAILKRMEEIQARLRDLDVIEEESLPGTEEGGASAATPAGDTTTRTALSQRVQALAQELTGTGTGADAAELSDAAMVEVEAELQQLEAEISEDIREVVPIIEKLRELHPWIADPRYQFMYSAPPDKKSRDFEDWKEDWSQVLFDFARETASHVIYPTQVVAEKPFAAFRERLLSVMEVCNHLVKKKLATWLSRKKESLRVYWKSLEEWADLIHDWARETGRLEPILVSEIRDTDRAFATLPEEDLEDIFKIAKKRHDADIVKLDDGTRALQFHF